MRTEKIARFGNYLFAFTVPFTHIGGYVSGIFGLVAAAGLWKKLAKEPLFLGLTGFVVYGLLRSSFSAEPSIGYSTMAGYLSHWLVPFCLGYAASDGKTMRRTVLVYGLVLLTITFFSLLAYAGLFYAQIGDNFFLVQEGLIKGLRSHIALAALCLLFSFVALVQGLDRKDLSKKAKVGYLLVSFFFLGILFLTGSRGYYIAAFFSYAGFGVVWLIRTRRIAWLIAGLFLLSGLIFMLYQLSPTLRNRIQHTGPGDSNVQERLTLYKVAWQEIKERPFTGFGPGQGIKQTKFFERLPENERNVQRHPHLHSFYLNLTADFGFLGLALFGAIAYYMFRGVLFARNSGDPFVASLAPAVFWGAIGILIGESFDTLLRGPGVAMELFWLAGLVSGYNEEKAPA